ncbi:hypothetical protein L5515_017082 [Caenorhabditis briggsae]|uniref:Uncharacterized protein n=1 Tax=Caenorhabditis briggsae TaxID=6238 RepID=A0AAE9JR30_CAEBR|nr:hypothetical protein L5515_017082 [Caenorhabditis briggsae]
MPNSKKKTIEDLQQLNEIRKEHIKSLTEIMEIKDQKFENMEKMYQGQEERLKNWDELMKNKDDMLDINEKIINRYKLEAEAQEKKIAALEEIINKYGPPNDTSMVTSEFFSKFKKIFQIKKSNHIRTGGPILSASISVVF